ncbi:DUF4252 domain-containing protein [Zeaxanthinibacter enoshimensis]|uniref:Uncharacterized protein DUF4252 n=1 Tax=Zeaxanthinibacter enoshimensis TaxID=392009 RepID=A0A4R6TKT4_9FLAO|nr:DUF4252 domain-containing protein [Zeaxanthinibacter enoshimensis]TDQ29462.1 uncharacterized protein DUF4252 [Zeaxanthinibacter enoshimensis]
MRKLVLVVMLAVAPLAMQAQSVFDRFEDIDGVTSVVVNKNMFNLLVKMDVDVDDPEAKEFMDIAKSLSGLKVFVTQSPKVSTDMKTTVDKYLKSSSLEELMRVKDKDANVKFYIKQGKDEDHVSELLMFVTGINNTGVKIEDREIETVLLSLTGDIDLTKIGALTKKMDLPQELNKAQKSNK